MGRAAVAVAAVVLTGVLGATVWYRAGPGDASTVVAPEAQTVDPAAPEAKLLDSVLYVQSWRDFGNPVGFAYVPRTRPPGLVAIGPGNPPDLNGGSHRGSGNGARLDSYVLEIDGARVQAVVEFAAGPTSTCADTAGMTHAVCVRDRQLDDDPADVGLRHTTVYFTAGSDAALTSAGAGAARRFWAGVAFVPVAEAGWYTDLVTRARAAVVRQARTDAAGSR